MGLLTVTPGLDTALVLRTAAVAGRAQAWGVILGIQASTLVWGALTSLGVTALLTASHVAYEVLRYAGAAYLVWIGTRMVWSSVRADESGRHPELRVPRGGFPPGFRQGMTTNLLNPKMGAFYVALLPQFIPASAPQLSWGMALAGVHVLLGVAWLSVLAFVAQSLRTFLRKRKVARGLDLVAGSIIGAFGVRLALPE